MSEPNQRSKAQSAQIFDFIYQRLVIKQKLDKLPADDPTLLALRSEIKPSEWLVEAAKRLQSQKKNPLRLATHPIKASHPDAQGSSLYVTPQSLPSRQVVGSHSLTEARTDAVGNAAVLDVYSLLLEEFEGETLLSLLENSDVDLLAILSDDADEAAAL